MLSLQRDLDIAKNEMLKNNIDVIFLANGKLPDDFWKYPWEERINISYETYQDMQQEYSEDVDLLFAYSDVFSEFFFDKSTNKSIEEGRTVPSVFVFFVNDKYFENLFGVSMEKGKLYAGEEAYKELQQMQIYYADPNIKTYPYPYPKILQLKDNKYIINGRTEYSLIAVPSTDKIYAGEYDSTYYGIEGNLKVSNSVFIPIDEFVQYREILRQQAPVVVEKKEQPMPSFQTWLSIKYKDKNTDINAVSDVLGCVMGKNNKIRAVISGEVMNLQRKMDSIDGTLLNMVLIAVSIMLIAVFGTIGMMFIFMFKRKKNIVVCVAYGSTLSRIFAEIFAEVFFVLSIGAMVGIYLTKLVTPYLINNFYLATVFNPYSIVIVAGMVVLSAFITTALSFVGIDKISLVKNLKEI